LYKKVTNWIIDFGLLKEAQSPVLPALVEFYFSEIHDMPMRQITCKKQYDPPVKQ